MKIPLDNNGKISVIKNLSITLRKGNGSCIKHPISQYVCIDNLSYKHQSFIVAIDVTKTPTSIQQTMKNEHGTHTMREEMSELKRKSTWEIVDKPRDEIVVGSKKPRKLNEREDEYVRKKLNMGDCWQTMR